SITEGQDPLGLHDLQLLHEPWRPFPNQTDAWLGSRLEGNLDEVRDVEISVETLVQLTDQLVGSGAEGLESSRLWPLRARRDAYDCCTRRNEPLAWQAPLLRSREQIKLYLWHRYS